MYIPNLGNFGFGNSSAFLIAHHFLLGKKSDRKLWVFEVVCFRDIFFKMGKRKAVAASEQTESFHC